MARSPATPKRRYAAPALEKGLDILELLASRSEGLGQSQIARALGRTPGEIFRMLTCLVERGYLRRGPGDDLYRLTYKLFELAHHHPPTRLLLDRALPPMHRFAEDTDQSVHLALRHGDHALIAAQVDGAGFMGFAVRVGARVPLLETVSGSVLLAFQPPLVREIWYESCGAGPGSRRRKEMESLGEAIRERGFEERESATILGITDVSYPVLDHTGRAVAALTCPCLTRKGSHRGPAEVHEPLARAAAEITQSLGAPEEEGTGGT